MEKMFITEFNIRHVRHLKDITIPLSAEIPRHLILTGKNGSGKTSVLDAAADYFERGITDLKNKSDAGEVSWEKSGMSFKFNRALSDSYEDFRTGKFILAYYKADRAFLSETARHIEKVDLQDFYEIKEAPRQLFVKYLVDMKVTEALARSSARLEKAEKINLWFQKFQQLLREIFEDNTLLLNFDEDTFTFSICEKGREPFDFNTMSRGFSAVFDIILDIMIRMEKNSDRKFCFDIPGIVLIDEIETHLHLELQKKIMPFLTALFPNLQFIVSTHSPFILNSLENAVIFDLENFVLVRNGMTDIPYDGIVEGYFHADVLSDSLKQKFERYKKLIHKEELDDNDFEEIARLEMFLNEIPDYLALNLTTEYQRLKEELAQREDIGW